MLLKENTKLTYARLVPPLTENRLGHDPFGPMKNTSMLIDDTTKL